MIVDNSKIFEPFEACKSLDKRMDYSTGSWLEIEGDVSYPYFLRGFNNVFIVYDFKEDKVVWYQKLGSKIIKKRGVRVWEAMRPEQQKLFLFDIDWFTGE